MTEQERQALEAARENAAHELTDTEVAGEMSERGQAWLAWKANQ